MRPRISVPFRFGVLGFVSLCLVAACTGDDEIYAPAKDAGPAGDATASSTSSGGASSSSGGSSGTPDGSTNDAPTDGGTDGGTPTDGGDGGTDSGTDGGVVVDSGADSGPVVCSVVACAANATCTALGCGSCNMGLGFCKP